ncbi:hypothetical protein [Microvirga lotononidis]|uniref:hypothetical protein n=1 Tax=Microvirga lotononidis TaxID=864069 RepID=UPI0012B5BF35|nr:hypothetical protein [Microvirga lotononidis]WQO28349.1 hypothetical protein U0023_04420 [Microvirga lotononidis]
MADRVRLRGLRVYVFGRVTGSDGTTGLFGFVPSRLKKTALQHRTNRKGITRRTKICVSVIPMNRAVMSVKGVARQALARGPEDARKWQEELDRNAGLSLAMRDLHPGYASSPWHMDALIEA